MKVLWRAPKTEAKVEEPTTVPFSSSVNGFIISIFMILSDEIIFVLHRMDCKNFMNTIWTVTLYRHNFCPLSLSFFFFFGRMENGASI